MGRFERKREKKKKFWMNVFLLAMFIFIIVGMTFGGIWSYFGNSELKYNDFKFYIKEGDNHYWTKIDGNEMPFYTLPSQVDYINVSGSVPQQLNNAMFVMVTFNPVDQASLQVIELARFDLTLQMGKVVVNGIQEESEDYGLPIITCNNASIQTPVIVFNVSDSMSIVDKDNCIYLNGRGTEFLRLRDRLLYSYYGVIKDE